MKLGLFQAKKKKGQAFFLSCIFCFFMAHYKLGKLVLSLVSEGQAQTCPSLRCVWLPQELIFLSEQILPLEQQKTSAPALLSSLSGLQTPQASASCFFQHDWQNFSL